MSEDRCRHGIRFPHECKECIWETPREVIKMAQTAADISMQVECRFLAQTIKDQRDTNHDGKFVTPAELAAIFQRDAWTLKGGCEVNARCNCCGEFTDDWWSSRLLNVCFPCYGAAKRLALSALAGTKP